MGQRTNLDSAGGIDHLSSLAQRMSQILLLILDGLETYNETCMHVIVASHYRPLNACMHCRCFRLISSAAFDTRLVLKTVVTKVTHVTESICGSKQANVDLRPATKHVSKVWKRMKGGQKGVRPFAGPNQLATFSTFSINEQPSTL